MTFKREDRYVVIKLKDLDKKTTASLDFFLSWKGIRTRDCVVVESDWPEYEKVWKMIEDRVNGEPREPEFAAAAWMNPGNGLVIMQSEKDNLGRSYGTDHRYCVPLYTASQVHPDLYAAAQVFARATGSDDPRLEDVARLRKALTKPPVTMADIVKIVRTTMQMHEGEDLSDEDVIGSFYAVLHDHLSDYFFPFGGEVRV